MKSSTLSQNRDREELVEEIAERLAHYGGTMWQGIPSQVTDSERAEAKGIISLTVKAIEEGEMELPNQVGRMEIDVATCITSGLLAAFTTWIKEMVMQKQAKVFIALRPVGKPSQEEEKNV